MNQSLKSIIIGISKCICLLIPFCIVKVAVAAMVSQTSTMGDFASNVLDPICVMTSAFYKICYVIGAALLVASIVQYKAHRNNPLQVRISQPIALVIFGIAFILLPIIGQLSTSAPSTGNPN
ncbi:hypothetical protein BH10PSE19_BH10PSE19_06280 [soil metagenome]